MVPHIKNRVNTSIFRPVKELIFYTEKTIIIDWDN
jgi:hypothetical protein